MKKLLILTLACVLCGLPLVSWGVAIDLSDFDYWDDPPISIPSPGAPPTYSDPKDNSSALMEEDPILGVAYLYKDYLAIPSDALAIEFDWTFHMGAGDQEDLNVYLYDATTFSIYAAFDEWIGSTAGILPGTTDSDTLSWDISAEAFVGGTVGMEFDWMSYPDPNDQGLDSWVEITDARIVTGASPAPVPEASTLILFGSGGLSLLGLYRPFRRRRR